MEQLIAFVKSLRMTSWIGKNIFIFAPTIFSLKFFKLSYLFKTFIAFLLFGLVTGCVYIFNDCLDKKKDQLHPEKCRRPIAAGKLNVVPAIWGASFLMLGTLLGIHFFNPTFLLIAVIYVGINILYTVFLKKVVILDVMVIAIGFVLRVEIGGVVNDIDLSPWLLIITFILAIFLGLVKRRQELVKLESDNNQSETRRTLKKYNISLLDQLISITTATTLISYIVYVLNPDIQQKFGTSELFLTVPFVVFGIFRYLYLTYSKGKGENPAEIIFSDPPFAFNILFWGILFVLLIEL